MKDLDGLKQQHPLDQVVARLTKQTPEAHKIRCPFHADDSPSLHVYDDASWHCFGCGKGGDVIDFAGFFYFGATYDPASHFLEVIDRLGGLGIEPIRPNERPLAPRPPAPTTVFDFDRIAYWHDAMPPSRRDYWHSRGLHDETIDRFRLGWDGWRYTIPVTFRGVCYGIKRRRSEIDDGLEGKYVMQKGSRVGIFNADILSTPFDPDLPLFIVEGEIEAMLLDQLGYQAISSTGGANTWKAHWSSFLAAVPRIVILYDNDEPGRQGALLVRSLIRRAHIWHWPDFAHDGGEFLPTDGAWDWLNAQIHSTPYQLPTNSGRTKTMGKPWLKLWTDTLSDRKLRRLKPAEKWCWVGLLLLAAETDDAGKIELADGVPMMADDFIDALDVEPETWESAYAYFLRLGMITVDGDGFVVVVNYAKRQEPKDPTAADRMRRYRDKSRTSKEVTADVTRNVTAMLRVEAEAEAEAETTTAASEFAALHRFWCDTTTRAGGGDTVSLQAVFDEWKDQIDSQGIRAAIVSAAQAKGMAATPAYLAGVLRNRAKAAKSGNGTLKMYVEADR